jgi:hypothetical protein
MLENLRPSLIILVKNGHNNGGRCGEMPLLYECARDGIEDGGARVLSYCGLSLSAQAKSHSDSTIPLPVPATNHQ